MIPAAANSHILMDLLLDRAGAQTYCRSRFTDMSSITTEEDNSQVSSQLQAFAVPVVDESGNITISSGSVLHLPEAWIGLSRYFWGWSDHNQSFYRQWGKKQSSGDDLDCVMMDSSSADWYRQHCDENLAFLCSTSESPITAESDLDHLICTNQVLLPLQPAHLQR